MKTTTYLISLIVLFLFIGCSRTHHVTDLGIRYFQPEEADPKEFSIVLGRFPEQRFGPPLIPIYSSWIIRKKDEDIKVGLVDGDHRVLSRGNNFIYALNTWSDIHLYAFLIPKGDYLFEYSFPVGIEYSLKLNKMYTRDLTVQSGELIYMGTHLADITSNFSYNRKVTSTYNGMKIVSNSVEDILSFREKYPTLFDANKFVIRDISK